MADDSARADETAEPVMTERWLSYAEYIEPCRSPQAHEGGCVKQPLCFHRCQFVEVVLSNNTAQFGSSEAHGAEASDG